MLNVIPAIAARLIEPGMVLVTEYGARIGKVTRVSMTSATVTVSGPGLWESYAPSDKVFISR